MTTTPKRTRSVQPTRGTSPAKRQSPGKPRDQAAFGGEERKTMLYAAGLGLVAAICIVTQMIL